MKNSLFPSALKFDKISICFFVIMLALSCTKIYGDAIDSIYTDEIHVLKGELEAIKVYSLTRISVADPRIADIADAKTNEILIIAKELGQTPLFIWDEHGKRTIMIHVLNQNLEFIKKRISKLFQDADIEGLNLDANEQEGKVVVSGEISKEKQKQVDQILTPFRNDTISLVSPEKIEDLIQIDLQVTELNTTLTKSLGVDWFAAGAGAKIESGAGGTLNPIFQETPPVSDGSIGDLFKIGDFNRTSSLIAQINALLEQGKARILSKPKLVVKSGEEATFLVGGEIPIRTTSATNNTVQENIEFKQFGIGMTITPEIQKDKIDILLNVEVSDVDAANKVGDNVAFTTRNAQTHLYLDNGQTIVLAGLIRQRDSEIVKKVPFLGDVPIVGLIFRTKQTPVPNEDQELAISLTPYRLTNLKEEKRLAAQKANATSVATPPQEEKALYSQLTKVDKDFTSEASASVGIPKEMADYVRTIQQRIAQAIVYPPEAKERGLEGTVKLGMLILNDGTLAYALVKESSGHDIFDQYALNMAKQVAPYSKFPSDTDLQELNVTIPIVYSLKRN